jgi:hypothetical protein
MPKGRRGVGGRKGAATFPFPATRPILPGRQCGRMDRQRETMDHAAEDVGRCGAWSWPSTLVPALALASRRRPLSQGLTPEQVVALRTRDGGGHEPGRAVGRLHGHRPRDEVETQAPPFSELWVVPAAGGEPRLIVGQPHTAASPQWSPDGTYAGVRGHAAGCGAAAGVRRGPGGWGAAAADPSPRGVGAVRVLAGWREHRLHGERAAPEEITQRRAAGNDVIVASEPGTFMRLAVQGRWAARPTPITPADRVVHDFAWSPDGRGWPCSGPRRPPPTPSSCSGRCTRWRPTARGPGARGHRGQAGPHGLLAPGRRAGLAGRHRVQRPAGAERVRGAAPGRPGGGRGPEPHARAGGQRPRRWAGWTTGPSGSSPRRAPGPGCTGCAGRRHAPGADGWRGRRSSGPPASMPDAGRGHGGEHGAPPERGVRRHAGPGAASRHAITTRGSRTVPLGEQETVPGSGPRAGLSRAS